MQVERRAGEPGEPEPTQAAPTTIRFKVYRTFYCATDPEKILCDEPICGGNMRTAANADATKEGGFAADPRWIPYGEKLRMPDGAVLVHDDNFGKAQRESDWAKDIPHIDIRVAGRPHSEVKNMGAGWIEVEVVE